MRTPKYEYLDSIIITAGELQGFTGTVVSHDADTNVYMISMMLLRRHQYITITEEYMKGLNDF